MATPRPTPQDPSWINTELKRLEQKITEGRYAQNLDAATLEGTLEVIGTILLRGLGILTVLTATDAVILQVGPQPYGDQGFTLTRENGVPAIIMRKPFALSTDQLLDVRDRFANAIFAEGAFAPGIEAPFLELPMRAVGTAGGQAAPTIGLYGDERTSSSSTLTTVFRCDTTRQNATGRFRFMCRVSTSGTTGDVRVVDIDNSNATLNQWFGSALVCTFSATTDTEVISPGLALPGTYGQPMRLGVQISRTAGAGTVTVAVTQSSGGAS